MPPYFKLSKIFLKLAREHGSKVLHGGNTPLLTKDLGDALRRQKKIIEDPDMGVLETTYEALPVIAEVKVLTMAVAKKLDIATKGQSAIGILEEIVQKTEAAGDSKSAQEIKNTLEWTQDFFSKPEIQQILQADLIEIEAPTGWKDFKGMGKSALQGAQRLGQEFSRLQAFLEKAKQPPTPKPSPKNDGPKT